MQTAGGCRLVPLALPRAPCPMWVRGWHQLRAPSLNFSQIRHSKTQHSLACHHEEQCLFQEVQAGTSQLQSTSRPFSSPLLVTDQPAAPLLCYGSPSSACSVLQPHGLLTMVATTRSCLLNCTFSSTITEPEWPSSRRGIGSQEKARDCAVSPGLFLAPMWFKDPVPQL